MLMEMMGDPDSIVKKRGVFVRKAIEALEGREVPSSELSVNDYEVDYSRVLRVEIVVRRKSADLYVVRRDEKRTHFPVGHKHMFKDMTEEDFREWIARRIKALRELIEVLTMPRLDELETSIR